MKKAFFFIVFILLMGCKDGKKYHITEIEIGSNLEGIASVIAFQKELNSEYKDPEKSPLPDRYRKDFNGLDFFKPDTTYIVKAKFVRTPEALPFLMPTTTNRKSKEVVYGIVYFSLNGKKHQLEVYQNKELMLQEQYKDYLFLPFLDETNGQETYDGGRYVDLSIPDNDTILIDFNKAYNPYCAYNSKYSCPLVPRINNLEIKVLAGVKAFTSKEK